MTETMDETVVIAALRDGGINVAAVRHALDPVETQAAQLFCQLICHFRARVHDRGHLGFGFGVHQCIGQNLARVELQVALSTLARRLPGLRLAVPSDELSYAGEQEIYTIHELPVTW
jgi:hypothetical protein